MDLSKLLSRKFLVGSGALAWTIIEGETDPNRLAAMASIAVAYIVMEGIKDLVAAKKAGEVQQ